MAAEAGDGFADGLNATTSSTGLVVRSTHTGPAAACGVVGTVVIGERQLGDVAGKTAKDECINQRALSNHHRRRSHAIRMLYFRLGLHGNIPV